MTDLGKQARWIAPEPSKKRRSHNGKKAADQKRKRNNYIQHRQRLYHVYGSICWLCGMANAAQVDHVIPLSQGGSNNFTNLRLAHDECNVARNRRNHLWHKSPGITSGGYPKEWNGMALVPDMWDEEFARLAIQRKRSEEARQRKRAKEPHLGKQAKWVDPKTVDLGRQAKWVDPNV